MLAATIWRDLRWRILGAAILVLVPAALVTVSYVAAPPAERGALSYAEFLDTAWFWLPGPSSIYLVVAVIVSAAGTLLRPRRDVAYLLALPVSRARWLLAHAGMSLAALAGLIVLADLVFIAGALKAGAPLPIFPLLARSLAVFVAAAPWVGVTLAVLTLVRFPLIAAVLVLFITGALSPNRCKLDLPVDTPPPPMLPAWDPWALADPRAWSHAVPAESLLSAGAFALAGLLVALFRLRRYEP
ncbi:MAG TPA: hypothetical protein VFS20_18095 [Longimicrobium sp.]|nr:hypothetical protein [Longimicrobium sp.]